MYVSADWHMDVAGMDQSCLHEGLPAVPGGLPLLAVHAAVDGVMLLLMLATNASIVAAIVRQRRRLAGVSLSARFAANLAAADAFVGAATVFYLSYRYVCASRVGLGGYKYTCVLRFVVVSSAHMTSAYSLVAIAVDRYIAVVHALRYKEIMNVRSRRAGLAERSKTLQSWTMLLIPAEIRVFRRAWAMGCHNRNCMAGLHNDKSITLCVE
ncbi:glucose-dependent insulinotropic receptor-like isoform X4 [Schistocerca serialis cubense]|uniref:glucose-dependent insulinotropic receptor-like isoform X4 n=1 Tax=Schistocerca serialis cubense TaxID=2023355 RepID=UPI00214E063F|nr:glucose-dependent insulinotropic receptor-like isoform X4 [Schistocerca serialis cubense]